MKITKRQLRRIIREEVQRESLLREGIFDVLGGLADGAIQSIKESIARKTLSLLGVETESKTGAVLINFFGNLEIKDLSEMLTGDNKCVTATGELAGALTETMVEAVPAGFGLKPEGLFTKSVQEALSKAMTKNLNAKIAEALCEIDYRSILEDIPGAGSLIKRMK